MLTVGLTGGIASGKSHVLRRLAASGFVTVDLDTIAHEVMAPGGTAHADVVKAFGPRIVGADGAIDRKALGSLVFADPAERRRLEALVHPRIREAEAALLGSRTADGVAVVDAALLVETGQHLRFARLVVVYCDPEVQLARLIERDRLPAAAARSRLDAQMAPADKKRFAHFVIDNSGSLADTDAQADAVAAALRAIGPPAAAPRVAPEDAARFIAAGPRQGPHGLSPWDLVAEASGSGALDLGRLARRVDPGTDRPWYALPALANDAPPETFAGPVALWAVARRPRDLPYTVAAAASVARLTHREPAAISGAVVAALAAARVLEDGARSLPAQPLPEWIAAATAWTGAPPPPSAMDPVAAAAREAAATAVPPPRVAEVARVLSPRP